jgi:2-polyprenyl-3-methyl-5-hydroxy-6-metoxy-1,4-benzoquinol methylase
MIYKSESFFNQFLEVQQVESRIDFFLNQLRNKSVLHIGCADTLFFNPSINLHIKLKKEIPSIIGYDIDKSAIDNLKKFCPGEYYTDYSDIKGKTFDSIIVPEVLEHIMNPEIFLEDILDNNFF